MPLPDFSWGNGQFSGMLSAFIHENFIEGFSYIGLGDTGVRRASIFSSFIEFQFHPRKYILSMYMHKLTIFITIVIHTIQENSMFLAVQIDLN